MFCKHRLNLSCAPFTCMCATGYTSTNSAAFGLTSARVAVLHDLFTFLLETSVHSVAAHM